MDISLEKTIPGFKGSEDWLFAHPSAVTNLYNPSVEKICVPALEIPSKTIEVRVTSGNTGPRTNGSLKRKLYSQLLRKFRNSSPLNCSGKFIFDARYDTDRNVAHLIRSATSVLFVKQILSEHLNEDITVHAVLRQNTSSLAHQVYDTCGIPVICTDGDIYGEIVVNSKKIQFENLPSTFPELLNFKFKNYHQNTPERIFIPRRGNRRLINNDEVIKFLEKRGFRTIYFEDLTISEEWSIARNVKVAVIVHGASIEHFRFNRLGLETSKKSDNSFKFIDIFSPAFTLPHSRFIVTATNGQWCGVRGQITPKILRDLDFKDNKLNPHSKIVKSPFYVDLSALEMALDCLDIDA